MNRQQRRAAEAKLNKARDRMRKVQDRVLSKPLNKEAWEKFEEHIDWVAENDDDMMHLGLDLGVIVCRHYGHLSRQEQRNLYDDLSELAGACADLIWYSVAADHAAKHPLGRA